MSELELSGAESEYVFATLTERKVAGRNIIVTTATVFVAALSR